MVHFVSILTRLGSSQGPLCNKVKTCKKLRRNVFSYSIYKCTVTLKPR